MKKLLMILTVIAFGFTACENESKNLSDKFEKLQKETDSIYQHHSMFKTEHQRVMAEHSNLSQQLQGRVLEDSTWLERLAEFEVTIKRHDAQMAKHEQLLQGHQELKGNFANLSADEMKAQIDEMKNDHDEIKNEHDSMMNEHESMQSDLEDMRENMSTKTSDGTGTGTDATRS